MNHTELLSFQNVSKKYRDILALDQISFAIKPGELFGYIGPNGAGKTTTIKIMVGLIKKFSGRYILNNKSIPNNAKDIHLTVGYLPQHVAFQEWRTVYHALHTFGEISGLDSSTLIGRIDEVLEIFEITDIKNKKINQLSGGTIQKIGFAQAILHNPNLLILDEPLAGLDPASRHLVKKIIRRLNENGTTIFFSSHILSDVQELVTKIAIIKNGRLLKIGSLNDLDNKEEYKNHIFHIILSFNSNNSDQLKFIPSVIDITIIKDKELHITIDRDVDIDDAAHILIINMLSLGYRIRSITPVYPNLDELYFKLIME